MKYTFPYMGPVVGYKKFLELMGYDFIMPKKPTKRTIELGAKYSPEFACFPYKVLMGTYIESCERGASLIITSGGHGPCRAGFYGEVHKRTLHKMGFNVDFIIFDSVKRDILGTIANFFRFKRSKSISRLINTSKVVYPLIKDLDHLEQLAHTIMPYEIKKGSVLRIWEKVQNLFDKVYSLDDLEKVKKESEGLFSEIELFSVPEEDKLRIGLVGEIFVVLESSINMEIENVMNSLGCETFRSHYISDWVDTNVFHKKTGSTPESKIVELGSKYIKINIGGHARQTIGHIVDFQLKGFDGVIHLMPFGCLPELVSQSVIPQVSNEIGMPVLTLSIDEQTGRSNNLTRLEAFVELIRSRKKEKRSSNEKSICRN